MSQRSRGSSHKDGKTQSNSTRSARDILIGSRYRIVSRLGGGAFGEVYKGVDVKTDRLVAMKMELTSTSKRSHLNLEYRIYRRLNECPVTIGIPKVYFCGSVGNYTALVMDLLGPSLDDLRVTFGNKLDIKTVCMLGVQLVQRLQYIHAVGFLHRDVKPENFVMGLGDNAHVLYAIDVGLAKAWRQESGEHVEYSEGHSLTGTARYVSINTHKGVHQSRRDDLEAVSYLLVFLARGVLPWQGLRAKGKKDANSYFDSICNMKASTTPEDLTQDMPSQFAEFIRYSRSLEFAQEPDYAFCTQLFVDALEQLGENYDYCFQWCLDPKSARTRIPSRSLSGHASEAVEQVAGPISSLSSKKRTTVAVNGSGVLSGSAYLPLTCEETIPDTSVIDGELLYNMKYMY